MRRVQWALLMMAAILLLGNSATAQSPSFIYTVLRNKNADSVTSTNVETVETRVLATFPRRSPQTLLELFPTEEISRLLDPQNGAWDIHDRREIVPRGNADVRVSQMRLSPSGDQIAVVVQQERLARSINDYFGVSQVVLISTSTGEQDIIFEIAYGDPQYAPGGRVYEQKIVDVQWTYDEQALVVAINPHFRSSEDNLVVVPVNRTIPFWIGSAAAWAVAPDRLQVAAITDTNGSSMGRTVTIFNFETHIASAIYIRRENYWFSGANNHNIVYLGATILFHAIDVVPLDLAWYYGLVTTNNPTEIVLAPFVEPYGTLYSNSRQSAMILSDNGLHHISLSGKQVQTFPITAEDDMVLDWAISTAGNVVVRLKRNPEQLEIAGEEVLYPLIDPNRNLPPDVRGEIVDFDW